MLVDHAHRRHFDVDEYHRMGDLGILPETGVELWDGTVIQKNGRGSPVRWTYDQYIDMGRGGILSDDERTELIDGEIVCMAPIGPRHAYVVDKIVELLGPWAPGRAVLRVQSPVRFNSMDAPHPDVTLLRLPAERYQARDAGPWDALLIIEVGDTSVSYDREVKAPMYARAAVPELWLVDLRRDTVVVLRSPIGGEYSDVREYARGDAWTSPALDGLRVAVDAVLGPS